MARRTLFVCDGAKCGAVLVNAEDGFVLTGKVLNTAVGDNAKVLIDTIPSEPAEVALCRECLVEALSLHAT